MNEIQQLIKRIEEQINKEPFGELFYLLCDIYVTLKEKEVITWNDIDDD
jgi:hypothetical protein